MIWLNRSIPFTSSHLEAEDYKDTVNRNQKMLRLLGSLVPPLKSFRTLTYTWHPSIQLFSYLYFYIVKKEALTGSECLCKLG